MYVLSFKPCTHGFGSHDPSAALFEDGELVFAAEEERFTRVKHGGTFPENAITACLDAEGLSLPDVDRIVLPYVPKYRNKIWKSKFKRSLLQPESVMDKLGSLNWRVKDTITSQYFAERAVREKLSDIGTPLPEIEQKSHHRCHAASAFYPTEYDEALVLTVDGSGEYDTTVVWKGDEAGLTRHKTFENPNSLGHFYGAVTDYLGYRPLNGEGKVMGLAPYGGPNEEIESALRSVINTTADYDVTAITENRDMGVGFLERLFERPAKEEPTEFTQWEKDLAYVTQSLLEEIVTNVLRRYVAELDTNTVCLAGGVALNCKMNQVVEQSAFVDELFVQPVANDAGLALGGGYLTTTPTDVAPMTDVYWGPEYDDSTIEDVLTEAKIDYRKSDDVAAETARMLADGSLVGWFQGRLELGPRALGNRSILADPRTIESRDNVNKYVKHREEWRPFAPSLKEEALDDYLVDATQSPFMIKTYDVHEDKRDEVPAILHPGDNTTRPQTVNEEQNPRYYALLSEFEETTGVPVLLNTSFNDHGEPIVNRPTEAIKDFYGMGLDVLVLGDYILEK
jgi:carbamoyltransferase